MTRVTISQNVIPTSNAVQVDKSQQRTISDLSRDKWLIDLSKSPLKVLPARISIHYLIKRINPLKDAFQVADLKSVAYVTIFGVTRRVGGVVGLDNSIKSCFL